MSPENWATDPKSHSGGVVGDDPSADVRLSLSERRVRLTVSRSHLVALRSMNLTAVRQSCLA